MSAEINSSLEPVSRPGCTPASPGIYCKRSFVCSLQQLILIGIVDRLEVKTVVSEDRPDRICRAHPIDGIQLVLRLHVIDLLAINAFERSFLPVIVHSDVNHRLRKPAILRTIAGEDSIGLPDVHAADDLQVDVCDIDREPVSLDHSAIVIDGTGQSLTLMDRDIRAALKGISEIYILK